MGKHLSENPKEVRKRERQVLELWLGGMAQEDIAQATGYTKSGVSKLLRRVLENSVKELAEEAGSVALLRLEALWQTYYPRARRGDVAAFGCCDKILTQYCKITGSYAPAKQEVSGPDGSTPFIVQMAMPTPDPNTEVIPQKEIAEG